jgi:hypothetical protein
MTESDQQSCLLQYGINFNLKKFLAQAPDINTPDVDKLGFCTIKHSTEVIIAVS